MGKIFIAIVLLIAFFSSGDLISDGLDNIKTDALTQSEVVVTAGGQTTANITLDHDLYQDDTTYVTAITSNITGESPIATAYTSTTNVLAVAALGAGETRSLVISYKADSEDTFWAVFAPYLAIAVFGGILFAIGWGVWQDFKGGRRRRY